MAYQPCRCSITLLFSVCISVFCTPLALSVIFPFILSDPYPFNATFLYCAFLPLRSASLLTFESFPSTTTLISSFFNILIVNVLLVYGIFAMPLHAHTAPNLLHILSDFPDHRNSLASLVVPAMHLASLGVLLRFFNLSGSWDSSSSLAQSSLCLLFQLQTSMLIHLSIPLKIILLHWKKLRDSSSPLAITQRSLWILWQRPSMVSSSYTVMCYSSPSILFKFTCTVGLIPRDLAFISAFWLSTVWNSCDHVSWHSQLRSSKRSLVSLALSSISRWCDQGMWPQPYA